jgi:hypothetical protein
MARTGLDEQLGFAAAEGDAEACKVLIDKGALVAAADDDGWTALHSAVSGGYAHVCALLIDHGADPRGKAEVLLGQRMNPMQLAVFAGNTSVVDYFVQTHNEDLSQVTESGSTLDDLAGLVNKGDSMQLHLMALRNSEATIGAVDAAFDALTRGASDAAERRHRCEDTDQAAESTSESHVEKLPTRCAALFSL